MALTDIFVASVAFVLGLITLLAGALNWEASFKLPKARSIEDRFGRGKARLFYIVLGAILILLACGILAGFGPFRG